MKRIQIIGPGCPRCKQLAAPAERAATELGLAFEMEKVQEIDLIVEMGVMATPALAVDGEVKVWGRVPPLDEIKALLQAKLGGKQGRIGQ